MTKHWIVLPLLMLMSSAHSEVVYDATILRVFTQSRLPGESDAHLIQLDQTLSSVCSANRVYIAFEDKELYAAALANYIAGKPVSLTYQTNGAQKTAYTHVATTCRLISIF